MMINHKIKVDLVRPGITPKIHVVQGDTNTRKISIQLFSDRRPWRIPEGAIVLIRYRKPDRTSGSYDTLGDGTNAITISGNMVSILVAPELLTQPGEVDMVVSFALGELRLSTFEIQIGVQSNSATSLPAEENAAWLAGFLPSPENSSVGQYLVVGQVNESGRILTVKAQNMPDVGESIYAYAVNNGFTGTKQEFARQLAKGSAEEIFISSEAPTDENAKVWINPDEESVSETGAQINVIAEVGQTIRIKAVDENGKPTEWEAVDYQEKICGQKIVDLFSETVLERIEEDGETLFYCDRGSELTSHETYTVNWNGALYSCAAIPIGGMWLLGNTVIVEGEDNGMPFTIGVTPFETIAIPLESIETATLSITGPAVQHLDDRYLPVLVVKSASETLPGTANYTSTEVHDAAASGKPVFLWVNNLPPYCCSYMENIDNGIVAVFNTMTNSTANAIYLDANGNLYQD